MMVICYILLFAWFCVGFVFIGRYSSNLLWWKIILHWLLCGPAGIIAGIGYLTYKLTTLLMTKIDKFFEEE